MKSSEVSALEQFLQEQTRAKKLDWTLTQNFDNADDYPREKINFSWDFSKIYTAVLELQGGPAKAEVSYQGVHGDEFVYGRSGYDCRVKRGKDQVILNRKVAGTLFKEVEQQYKLAHKVKIEPEPEWELENELIALVH